MKSMQCININGYQYKDYPELLKALVTVKKAALISAKNLKRADDSLLDKLILTCDQFLQSDNVLNIQVDLNKNPTNFFCVDSIALTKGFKLFCYR